MVKITSEKNAKQIAKSGAKASAYARSPIRGAGFLVNAPNNDSLKIFSTDEAEVEININKDHTQALVNVDESARTLTTHGERWIDPWDVEKQLEEIRGDMNNSNPLFIPHEEAKRASFVEAEEEERIIQASEKYRDLLNAGKKIPKKLNNEMRLKVRHTVSAPETSTNLLMGIDEVAHFICALPERVNTVEEAHELLRPKGVKPGTLRQGEWFFKKITHNHSHYYSLYNYLRYNLKHKDIGYNDPGKRSYINDHSFNYKIHIEDSLERGSSHKASLMLVDRDTDRKFVKGLVYDSRNGRHDPLIFNDWHEVVRNNEVFNPAMMEAAHAVAEKQGLNFRPMWD